MPRLFRGTGHMSILDVNGRPFQREPSTPDAPSNPMEREVEHARQRLAADVAESLYAPTWEIVDKHGDMIAGTDPTPDGLETWL